MKYKIGEQVRVRSDLVSNVRTEYAMDNSDITNTVTDRMMNFLGKIVTIADYEYGQYNIKEDNGVWCWTDEMFESKAATLSDERQSVDLDITKLYE